MKSTIILLAVGLCSVALTGCETSNRGPYDSGLNRGPVGRSVVVVPGREPGYRVDRPGPRRAEAPGRDYRNDRRDSPRGRYDRVRNDREPCPGDRNFDPRRDRCNR